MSCRARWPLHLIVPLALIGMLAMTGCTPLTDPQATDTVDPAVIAAQNRFGLSLYHRLASGGTANEQGIFISPSSIALALAMTYNGARGETQTAMSHALGYDSLSL
jgi:serine protease inhibitor